MKIKEREKALEENANSTFYTLEDVAKHNIEDDCWIAYNGRIYDVTIFAEFHPGGKSIILEYKGTDSTKVFWDHHH